MFGLLGISCGLFLHLILLFSYTSFGIPFLTYNSFKDYLVKPVWKNEKRNSILNTKRPIKEPIISMKWRKDEK